MNPSDSIWLANPANPASPLWIGNQLNAQATTDICSQSQTACAIVGILSLAAIVIAVGAIVVVSVVLWHDSHR